MQARILAVAAISMFIGIGGKGCSAVDPGGSGGSPNLGGFMGAGGSAPSAGGSTISAGGSTAPDAAATGGSAAPDAAPACTNTCCTTCRILAGHGCEEGTPPEECEPVCLNSEDGPSELQWKKLSGNPSLATIRQSYECTGGQ